MNETNNTDDEVDVPDHIVVVMDGNGRWASKRMLLRAAGHKSGVHATRELIDNCINLNIPYLTIFAFSSENWKRPVNEVNALMSLFISTLNKEMLRLHDKNIRVRFIGDVSKFDKKLINSIDETKKLTENNTGLQLNIAANYGGRWDLLNAFKKITKKIDNGDIHINDLSEEILTNELCLSDVPAPDLLIRTGGEQRISNFLLWQLAYSELYFTEVLWPDFNKLELLKAINWFSSRQRRFGKTSQQVDKKQKAG